MTTLIGISLAGRSVLFVGGGSVAARRLGRFLAEGALVRVVAPELHPSVADAVAADAVAWTPRAATASDLDGAWLVHAATGDTRVDGWVARECDDRHILCVNASDGGRGTARLAAEARAEDTVVGVVSDAGVDPARSAQLRDAIADGLHSGRLPLRRRRRTSTGQVALVGGGPGAADLMTVRGRMLLAQADIVIADRLGPIEVLDELEWGVEVIDVGKRPGHHPVPQERINELLIEKARAGKRVVRLKGGDPFVFGRGGEEMAACLAAGVAVEVVPGISSALAVPQAAGIPVTHRGVAAGLHVVNGQSPITPATLAALNDPAITTVVLMGVAALERIVQSALAAEVPADTPVAIIENGHTAKQRTARTTLGQAVHDAREAEVRNPAVIVIGRVAHSGLLLAAASPVGAEVPW